MGELMKAGGRNFVCSEVYEDNEGKFSDLKELAIGNGTRALW